MLRATFLIVAASLVAGTAATTNGQQKFPPAKFVDLQVLPKDASPDVVIGAMKNFTRYLGVRCPHCHVGEEGQPLDTFDFVSDAKPQKNIARAMMRLTADVNAQIAKAIPDATARGPQATCYTCHRGQVKPISAP